MRYRTLGTSELEVSEICLGTMTWGKQNTQEEADQQLDYAIASGINFIDTAEVYAVPPTPETYGTTEQIIGSWLSRNPSRRNEIVLATKIGGVGLPWVRDGAPIDGKSIIDAVDNSLQRLQTDYIDLFQIHWPNRPHPHFGNHWPQGIDITSVDSDQESESMLDILNGLADCISAGKVRACGLSDETPWGINQYLRLSEKHSLPPMVSIQNEFNLLDTKDWPYLIETCVRSDVAYLPWSPLAQGILSGKYRNGAIPAGSRWDITPSDYLFRNTEATHRAIEGYQAVAERNDLNLAQMALAWVFQVEGVTSTIIGATSMEQLKQNVSAYELDLPNEVVAEIGEVLKTNPAPF